MAKTYAADQVFALIKRGPAEGEDFYRLHMSGNGPSTKHLNVSDNEALAIATVLNFAHWESLDPAEVGAMFLTILTSEVTMRDLLALAAEVQD
jgi:hypothetical protein